MFGISYTCRSGPLTFYIPLVPMTNWPNKLLSLLNIFSLSGKRADRRGVYYGDIMVSML